MWRPINLIVFMGLICTDTLFVSLIYDVSTITIFYATKNFIAHIDLIYSINKSILCHWILIVISLNIKEINLIEGWRQHIFSGLCSTEFVFSYFEKFRFSSCQLCMSTLRISIKTMLFSKNIWFTITSKMQIFDQG